jgi:anti-sigma regulatory factor (Ser/Thr protein kinase)
VDEPRLTEKAVRLLADHVTLDLPMSAGAPAVARRAIEGLGLEPGAEESASLLVSELVSNAVRHSGAGSAASIQLRVGIRDRVLRMSVTDAGTGFAPRARLPEPGVAGGFGLFLIERLAGAWGVETDERTTVWLELALGR